MRWFLGAMCALLALSAGSAGAEETTLSVLRDPGPPAVERSPLPLGSKPRSVSLARVGDSMKHGQVWAVLSWGKSCPVDSQTAWDSSKDGYTKDPVVERMFRDELTALGFNVAGDPNNLFKGEEADGAELQVGALITDVSVLACGGFMPRERKLDLAQTHAIGSVQMSVEWQIYSPVESRVVAKVPTVVRLDYKDPQTNLFDTMINAVFARNVVALAASEPFRAAVLSSGPSVSALRTPSQAPSLVLRASQGATPRPLSEASGSVVALFAGDAMGSGFLISRDGYLLTNRHVVGASRYLKVKWSDGAETVGEVIRSDLGRDIALVKTDPRGRQPIGLRRGGVQSGDTVFAIGTPLDPKLQGSLTQGIVSANRILDGYSFIQSDVVVNPGNSGGPLLNARGEAVGVTVSGIGQAKAPRGINFFIPIDDALDFLSLKVAETRTAR